MFPMATQQVAQITVNTDHLEVTDLKITDSEVIDYLNQYDPDEQLEAFNRALRVGVLTVGLAGTSQEEEFVKRSFEEMRRDFVDEIERIEREVENKFGEDGSVPKVFEEHLGPDGEIKRHLEEAFGDDGIFVECLDNELGADGERFREALDPDDKGTPTYRLRKSILDEIKSLRDKIEAQTTEAETHEEIVKKTPLKGEEFEGIVHQLLSGLVYGTSDEVSYTANREGDLDGREVGDFVVTLNDTGQRIVVEAKSNQGYSQRDIKEELSAAIENRNADYGIIVFECESYIPNKVGYFHEFDDERLTISLSQNEEDEIDPAFLSIGFNWARTRVIQKHADADSTLDPERIQTAVTEITDSIGRFSTIRRKSTRIKGITDEIDTELSSIESDIKSRLADIRMEIQASEE